MEFDSEDLREFVVIGDKSPPPVFVGREDILQDIEATAGRIWKGPESLVHGNPGETRVVQGAPGAGKSSIIVELTNRLQEKIRDSEENPSVPVPRVVNISPEMVADDLPGVLTILAGAAGLSSPVWRKLLSKLKFGVALRPDSVTPELGWDLNNQEKPRHIWDLASLFPPSKWKAPVILAIDEAQTFSGGMETSHAGFLRSIHNSDTNLPLSLVLAGLGDTAERASQMNLTRGKKVHEIGSLTPEEAGEFMLSCCRRFGMDPLGHEERIMELAAPCEGWPRHLHFALQTLGREALKSGGDLSGVAWKKIQQEAAQSRTRYYQGQQSKIMAGSAHLVGAIMKSMANNSDLISVHKIIRKNARDEDGWRLPKDMDIVGFLNHLVHQGALLESVDNTISLGIPSFRSYLVKAGGLTLLPPSNDMIRQARSQCRIHGKALREWQEQGSLLESEFQSAEQVLAGLRDEFAKIGFLSFQRKRRIREGLAKGEEQLADIRDRQRKRPPPPMPPSPKILGTARCQKTWEAAGKGAV
ncbi:MAG: hypothetical protein OXC82_05400 [Rhodobacteraceae bacterium]|nr:hypothetical protein [Paracoccaceae bacterium]MCY4249858.1 hypothetical protein [Paracoccaceae bacterium]